MGRFRTRRDAGVQVSQWRDHFEIRRGPSPSGNQNRGIRSSRRFLHSSHQPHAVKKAISLSFTLVDCSHTHTRGAQSRPACLDSPGLIDRKVMDPPSISGGVDAMSAWRGLLAFGCSPFPLHLPVLVLLFLFLVLVPPCIFLLINAYLWLPVITSNGRSAAARPGPRSGSNAHLTCSPVFFLMHKSWPSRESDTLFAARR